MTAQLVISYIFYGMASISVFCFVMLSALYWKRERNEVLRMDRTRDGIGDIAALFQNMRDILEQQKHLAREFNEELDKKQQVVKQVLEQSLGRNEELYERQRLLTRELELASLEVKSLQRKIEELEDMMHTGYGLESRKTSDVRKIDLEPRPPDSPADPEKARDAFRTLLEMQRPEENESSYVSVDEDTEEVYAEPGHVPERSGPSLRRQVEECDEAGMSVVQIAEKLNVSRGEVRLMLSMKDG